MYYVYILKWTRYYVGYTNNLIRRLIQHQNWKTYSTSRYGELSLIGYFLFQEKNEAVKKELEIKKSKNIEKRTTTKDFIATDKVVQ